MDINVYKEYCTGCGLCKSIHGVKFETDNKGFEYPVLNSESLTFCEYVCPCGGKATTKFSYDSPWGKSVSVYLGWSLNDIIRKQASSGGILTTLCVYLLEKGMVNGIIQTKGSDYCVYSTTTVISRSKDEILRCMGSRYAMSSPLSNIKQIVRNNEVYAFVGKPCDVSALQMYLEKDLELQKKILYIFSFFCAGEPSNDAQLKLLNHLGCSSPKECSMLQYRGNGWPGYATAIRKDGTVGTMSYNDSWGKILGRDVRKSCRFCIDGIGELADISCGDAWLLTSDKKPDFSEALGRNVVFARTKKGDELLHNILIEGQIILEDYIDNLSDLKFIQKYQFERRATMSSMLNALRLFRKDIPNYDRKVLRIFAKDISLKKRIRRFIGMIKRIKQNRV